MKQIKQPGKLLSVILAVILLVGSLSALSAAVNAAPNNETVIYNFLVTTMGLNPAGACGVLVNIEYESDFDPHCYGDGGTSYGICQWHQDRFSRLRSFCAANGFDYTTVEGQLHYLNFELKNYYPSVYDYLRNVPNTSEGAYNAAYHWCYYFEVPANREYQASVRGSRAMSAYWPVYGSGGYVPTNPTQPVVEPTTRPGGSDQTGTVSKAGAYQIFTRLIQLIRVIVLELNKILS